MSEADKTGQAVGSFLKLVLAAGGFALLLFLMINRTDAGRAWWGRTFHPEKAAAEQQAQETAKAMQQGYQAETAAREKCGVPRRQQTLEQQLTEAAAGRGPTPAQRDCMRAAGFPLPGDIPAVAASPTTAPADPRPAAPPAPH